MAYKEWTIQQSAFNHLVAVHGIKPRLEQGAGAKFYSRKAMRPLVREYLAGLLRETYERCDEINNRIEAIDLEG
jgi:hypothetical protein